ncbi:MAG: flagellar basal body-associated FliL family protein [Acidobacteriota bacterium]
MSTQPNPEQAAPAEEPKKSRKGLFLVLAAVAFLVVGGGGAGAFFLMRSSEASTESDEATTAQAEERLVSLETFVVNLADPGGNRYLKATIRAVTRNPGLEERIVNDDILRSRIRNKVLTILSSKTYDSIGTPVGKEALRRELIREVNKLLGNEDVEDILFVEFIVQ